MARPRKEGMEYFPHDTDARNDLKIRKLRAVFGNDGYATYFILLENIYRNKSYSIDVSDAETMLILAEECKISEDKLSQIMLKCCDLDLFSKQIFQADKLLTSEGIKKRTEPIENKRKKNNESYNTSKAEVSDAETITETDISDTQKGAESTQSKGKKRKVENTKVIKNKYAEYVAMTEEEYIKLIQDHGESVIKNKIIDLNLWKGSKGKTTKSDYMTILAWIRKDNTKTNNISNMVKDQICIPNAGARKEYRGGNY